MKALAAAVARKKEATNLNARVAISTAIIEGRYSELETYTNVYGVRMVALKSSPAYRIPREVAVAYYREYKATGKVTI